MKNLKKELKIMKKKILITILVIILVPVVLYFFFPKSLINASIYLQRSSSGLSVKSIDVNDHKFAYMEGGSGETILFVHGYTGNKDNWTALSAHLTPEYHVIAVDLQGHGDSSKVITDKFSIKNQAMWLNEFCEAINIQKFHIAGCSMGGSVSGCYSAAYPDKVLSLALFDTGGVYSAEKSDFIKLLEKGSNLFKIESVEDFDRLMKYVFVKPPPMPGIFKQFFLEEVLANQEINAKIFADIIEELFSLEPLLDKIKVKTFVLWGDADKLLHVSAVKILSKGLPFCKSVIMKDCGHCPMIERPEETYSHYNNFLLDVKSGKI